MNKLSFLIILITLFCCSVAFAQEKEKGKLGRMEDEVSRNSDSNGDSEDESDYCCDEGFYADHSFIEIIFYSEADSMMWDYGYSDFPYAVEDVGLFSPDFDKQFMIGTEISYFHESKKLTGFNFIGRFSPHPVFGLEIRYADLTEQLKTRYDHLRLFNIFLNYNRLKAEHAAVWWGLGMKGMRGDRSYYGFAINAGTEIYPTTPLSFTINYNLGFINSTNVSEFLVGINFHIERAKIFIGYQNFKTGFFSISGFTIGTGIYF